MVTWAVQFQCAKLGFYELWRVARPHPVRCVFHPALPPHRTNVSELGPDRSYSLRDALRNKPVSIQCARGVSTVLELHFHTDTIVLQRPHHGHDMLIELSTMLSVTH